MTKNELAREVSVSEKQHLSTTVKAIDGTLRVIKEALAKGEVVVIRGFGTFTPVELNQDGVFAYQQLATPATLRS